MSPRSRRGTCRLGSAAGALRRRRQRHLDERRAVADCRAGTRQGDVGDEVRRKRREAARARRSRGPRRGAFAACGQAYESGKGDCTRARQATGAGSAGARHCGSFVSHPAVRGCGNRRKLRRNPDSGEYAHTSISTRAPMGRPPSGKGGAGRWLVGEVRHVGLVHGGVVGDVGQQHCRLHDVVRARSSSREHVEALLSAWWTWAATPSTRAPSARPSWPEQMRNVRRGRSASRVHGRGHW